MIDLKGECHALFLHLYRGNLFFNRVYSDPRLPFIVHYGGIAGARYGMFSRTTQEPLVTWFYRFEYGYHNAGGEWYAEPLAMCGNHDIIAEDILLAKLLLL